MKRLSIVIFLFLLSCKNDLPKKNNQKEIKNSKIEEGVKQIEVLFDEVTFQDDYSLPLLRELGKSICSETQKDLNNFIKPACNPKYFKFFSIKKNTSMKDAFALLIKSKVHGFPIRRLFVYQREGEELIKVNGFAANLIEIRNNTNSSYSDLILRFNDEDQNHFNCLYVWRSNHYEFEAVEQINDANIKKEFKDSMNREISKFIEKNRLQAL